ncbi:MAG: DUF4143 domain-containing protein [Clostridia bacterium]|nr:DUF4143 domain-containing protein [Clostridia bacterium]
MNYINRAIESKIIDASSHYPVVMVCGQRQTGKSTMLVHIKEDDRTYVNLRDPYVLELATESPKGFFDEYRPPLIIDEFQLAPQLLSYIQYLVDEKKRLGENNHGMIWLTGSQKFLMMKNVSESLAGRCAFFDMSSFSSAELDGRNAGLFDPDLDSLRKRCDEAKLKSTDEIFDRIRLGGMPGIYSEGMEPVDFFRDYVSSYLMRDVLEYGQVAKIPEFLNFLRYMAVTTGQELNISSVSKELCLNRATVTNWVSVLNALGVIRVIEPFYRNDIKRMIKTPKFYFMDTGLVCYLCRITSSENLRSHPRAGALFETYVVSEIVKSYYNARTDIDLCYYRDTDKREIDLIAVKGEKLYPIEIKLNHSPSGAAKNMKVLDGLGMDVQPGIVICPNEKLVPCGKDAWFFPVSAL